MQNSALRSTCQKAASPHSPFPLLLPICFSLALDWKFLLFLLLFFLFVGFFVCLFLAILHGLRDLSSLPRDRTHALGSESAVS